MVGVTTMIKGMDGNYEYAVNVSVRENVKGNAVSLFAFVKNVQRLL